MYTASIYQNNGGDLSAVVYKDGMCINWESLVSQTNENGVATVKA